MNVHVPLTVDYRTFILKAECEVDAAVLDLQLKESTQAELMLTSVDHHGPAQSGFCGGSAFWPDVTNQHIGGPNGTAVLPPGI